jgi:hypothetical protein
MCFSSMLNAYEVRKKNWCCVASARCNLVFVLFKPPCVC